MRRRTHTATALLAALATLACTASPSGAAEATADPLERARALAVAGEDGPAVEVLTAAVKGGAVSAADLLVTGDLEPLRGADAFRDLVCDHAAASRLHLAPEGEPGVPLRLTGRVVDAAGSPVAGAHVYAYQTDARGYYSRNDGEDSRNPRLFACGKSDRDGRVELVSVLPGSYPGSSIQRHVHYRVEADGHPELVGEVLFADDENLGDRARSIAARRGWPVVEAPRGADGVRRGEFELRLEG